MPTGGVITETHELSMAGLARRYVVIRPGDVHLADLPVIIDLHGSGSNPDEHAAVTAAASWAEIGALVVLPQAAIPFQLLADWPAGWAWNVPGSPLPGESVPRDNPDDLAFIDALVSRLINRHDVDPDRVHLRGYSGGARLSSHVMATAARRLRSVCCVGGVRFIEPSTALLPPMLAIHGRRDTFNPYEGGAGPRWSESVESVVQQWARATGCLSGPREHTIADGVYEARYTDTTGLDRVRLISVESAAHSWPGTRHSDHIAQFGAPGDFDASHAHWDFIRDVETFSATAERDLGIQT